MSKKYLDSDGLKVYHDNNVRALNKKANTTDVYNKNEIENKLTNIDYSTLKNKPKIEGIELSGNKTFSELGIATLDETEILAILD